MYYNIVDPEIGEPYGSYKDKSHAKIQKGDHEERYESDQKIVVGKDPYRGLE